MSIRDEIRAGLVKLGSASVEQLLPLVPGVDGDRKKLSDNLSQCRISGLVRRCGMNDAGEAAWTIDAWPVDAEGKTVRKARGARTAATPPPRARREEGTGQGREEIAARGCQIVREGRACTPRSGARSLDPQTSGAHRHAAA